MIHLRLRTEYSFRKAYGKIDHVLDTLDQQEGEVPAAGITDNGTWGHVAWRKACKKRGIKPIFGIELPVVQDARKRERQALVTAAFLARNNEGLAEIYELSSRASTELFYFHPRIDYTDIAAVSENIIILSGAGADIARLRNRPNLYLEYNPSSPVWNKTIAGMRGYNKVVCADNLYPTVADRPAYEVLTSKDRRSRTTIMHIPNEYELRLAIPYLTDEEFLNNERIAADCNANLPKANMVKPPIDRTLRDMCIDGARDRRIDLTNPVYSARLERELSLIHEKEFEDYFYVIADMVNYAKTIMLVGPARGSSAGSLVCFLLGITDVDPIKHDLMFERFIDITRADLPDIDIDFQDDRRELVIEYLRTRYGAERVGRIGTVNRYKAKSTLGDVAKELNIPAWEVKDVKDAIVERSTGDARAQFCIQDTLESLDIGRALVQKYPAIAIAGKMEGHARHSGMHAAGVLVTAEAVSNFCSLDHSGAAQIDKKDAEELNMLKIDVLGLRTLSVIQDTLDQIGKDRQWLVDYPLDDTKAFEVFNDERYSGIFQYEGYALQSLVRQMKIHSFDDIVIITALARPGPLHCGAATEFIARRIGQDEVVHLHPLAQDITEETYGSVIYQEQVMAIGRKIGQLSWEHVSELRKAMSKSLGEEFFNRYWEMFKVGAEAQGIPELEARRIWEKMCTFGSWAFNKSHAVSYGLLSYWCAVLKAHYPLQFAAACLRNAKDEEQSVKLLRELVKEGYEFIPVHPEHSGLTWQVVDGKLVGGLTNVKGLGFKKAQDILSRRADGRELLPGQKRLLAAAITPYDDIFEGTRRFGDIYANPRKYNILSGKVHLVNDIQDAGDYVFIARIREKNLRDLNEYGNLVKRGGRLVKANNLFLNLVLEDDSGSIIAKVQRFDYQKWGKPLVEAARINDWFLWKGKIKGDGWRMLMVEKWRKLD